MKVCILKLSLKVTERPVPNVLIELRKFLSKLQTKARKKKEIYSSNVPRLLLTPRLFLTTRNSSQRWSSMPFYILMKIYLNLILVSRKSPVDPLLIHSWYTEFASERPSPMQVSNNNQRDLRILKFWFFNTSLSLKLKKIMPKLELKTLMISKRLLMPNGILFTINLTKLLHQELKLSFPTFQLVILLLNTLLIKISSVPVESKKMIYKEFPKHLEPFFKPPSTA